MATSTCVSYKVQTSIFTSPKYACLPRPGIKDTVVLSAFLWKASSNIIRIPKQPYKEVPCGKELRLRPKASTNLPAVWVSDLETGSSSSSLLITETSEETPIQNHPGKPHPNSWLQYTVEDNKCWVF